MAKRRIRSTTMICTYSNASCCFLHGIWILIYGISTSHLLFSGRNVDMGESGSKRRYTQSKRGSSSHVSKIMIHHIVSLVLKLHICAIVHIYIRTNVTLFRGRKYLFCIVNLECNTNYPPPHNVFIHLHNVCVVL